MSDFRNLIIYLIERIIEVRRTGVDWRETALRRLLRALWIIFRGFHKYRQ